MEAQRGALAAWLAAQAEAKEAEIIALARLSGGAIQENWGLEVAFTGGRWGGRQALVVRTDAPSGVAVSLGRPQEFALFQAAFSAGVTVPEPLWQDADGVVLGKPFFVMRRVNGTAAGHRLVKDAAAGGGRVNLAERLGRELARIHSIRPPRAELAFLGSPPDSTARRWIAEFRGWLDRHEAAHPALEWGLRWLERHAADMPRPTLCHNDFRTGNIMVDAQGVSGILDWEFAGWGDPLADIGWFCAPCWRFGALEREAGGLGAREDFYRGYESQSGTPIDRARVPYWEAMATLRWAIIALQQAERHVSGGERNLELALTAHILPALELDLLEMTREHDHA
ncbi:phosphotransferase family protein [Hyalangium rubrum]|uniref:Phosphotransferase family protein n=1 Tax=Hyalangium rubrum TaxID=3103134 RepID=A0ABU5H0B8_9BACT|nr:phosphotransferase family protein [Hyalangium sp. s54d21]MDY7226569.1 phosphotransferase family protein [Hyalangium sp. s54d21]